MPPPEIGNRVDPTPAYRPISVTLHEEISEDGSEDAYLVSHAMRRPFENEPRSLGYQARIVAKSSRFIRYSHIVPAG